MKILFTSLVAIILLVLPKQSNAQDQKTDKKEEAKQVDKNKEAEKGDIYITPVPVIGANPAFGFIYGLGAAGSAYFGDPSTTNLSSALVGVALTTKKQTIITLKSSLFTENNEWILMGDWRYLNSSQPTWGIGTGPQSARMASNGFEFEDKNFKGTSEANMMEFKFFRFYETALKKMGDDGFYAGLGIHIDAFNEIKDQLLELHSNPDSAIITPYYAYTFDKGFNQKKSTLVGLSLNGSFDTRDNINNPFNGRYALLSFKINPEAFGSDQNSTQLWLEYRDYFNLTEDHKNIIAMWTFGNFTTSGNLPYMNLPASAWDQYAKSSEPYAQGRFRGTNLVFAGLEYRKHILSTTNNPRFLGTVFYLNGTTASGEKNGIDLFDYVEPGYGLGLRINISQKARTNLGIDYGWGNYGTSGLFLRLNENF